MNLGQKSSDGAAPAHAAAPSPARSATLPPPLPVSPRAVKVRISQGGVVWEGDLCGVVTLGVPSRFEYDLDLI